MGLLDSLKNVDPATAQGLLQMGLSMLQSKGSLANAIGQGGMAGIQGANQYKDRQAQIKQRGLMESLTQQQIAQGKRMQDIQGLAQKFASPGQMPETMDARDIGQPGEAQIPSRGFDAAGFGQALMAFDPMQGLQFQAATTKQRPALQAFKPGDVVGSQDATGKFNEQFRVPEKPDPSKQSNIAQLTGEMNALPPGSPMRAVYEAAIKKAVTHAPAASATVINKQEGEEAKTVGKYFGEEYANVQKAGMQAGSKINRVQRLEQLLSGYTTGKLTPLGKDIASAAQTLGVRLDPNLANKEAAEALSNELALEARNPSGGAGMPGAMSDKDREFLQNMTPNLSKTQEGNKLIIETHKKLAKRDQEVAKLAREYRQRRGTVDEGFFDVLRENAEKNPLFSGPAQKPAGEWSITPVK